ncbi:hypothetical protein COX85_02385 [Candidatus Micrarchaeota archaeon CG_4_10_14_0_2_um_filter_55_9]|nr:MAG: hypothetical protein AUJ15_00090 [Candidatus Micrarchaeota archaeon CG1_02_55_41]PIZ91719.1 MAG: hypothetical protein COX85_02385 [Candidatus Micrarchaeota archaeon CG_4_10_14_0_2_um_filter_55_9]
MYHKREPFKKYERGEKLKELFKQYRQVGETSAEQTSMKNVLKRAEKLLKKQSKEERVRTRYLISLIRHAQGNEKELIKQAEKIYEDHESIYESSKNFSAYPVFEKVARMIILNYEPQKVVKHLKKGSKFTRQLSGIALSMNLDWEKEKHYNKIFVPLKSKFEDVRAYDSGEW